MFQGRMPVEKRNLILEYENCHPTVLATIAYGSGAIPQQNSSYKDKKQIDLIEVVDDLEETIVEHMIQHPENFTPSTLRFFRNASLKQLERGAPIVYFTNDSFQGETIKRGFISKQQFLKSIYENKSLFVPFRLQKVVELVQCRDDEIYRALVYEHQKTLMEALLMLPKEKHNLYDLMMRICSFSYLGDLRMKLHCEDPNKIKNIVDGQLEYFYQDYEEVNYNYYQRGMSSSFGVNYEQIQKDFSILPLDIQKLLESYTLDENSSLEVTEALEQYFIAASKKENLKQIWKGIQTVGVQKAFVYGLRKAKKGMIKKS